MNRTGFVLPTVLMTLLVIGVVSFALSLVATLELLSARSAANAVAARAAAEGAVALALAAVYSAANEGSLPAALASPGGAVYGPWPDHGVTATASLRLAQEPEAAEGAETLAIYRLESEAAAGRALSTTSLVFALEPRLTILERRR